MTLGVYVCVAAEIADGWAQGLETKWYRFLDLVRQCTSRFWRHG